MYSHATNTSIELENSDLQIFKNYSIIFLITRFSILFKFFFIYLLDNTLGLILFNFIDYVGVICFALGIYKLTTKYSSLSTGKNVVYLFIATIVVMITQLLFNVIFSNAGIGIQNVNALSQQNLPVFIVNIGFIMVFGIIIILTGLYFTRWFNDGFSRIKATNAYYYYGLFYGVGSIVIGIDISFFSGKNFDGTYLYTTYLPATLIFIVATTAILTALVLEIIAGFKIYNRVNAMILGKSTYTSNPLPKSDSLPFHSITPVDKESTFYQDIFIKSIKSDNNPLIPKNRSSSSYSKAQFCKNCGEELDSTFKFCQMCGRKV